MTINELKQLEMIREDANKELSNHDMEGYKKSVVALNMMIHDGSFDYDARLKYKACKLLYALLTDKRADIPDSVDISDKPLTDKIYYSLLGSVYSGSDEILEILMRQAMLFTNLAIMEVRHSEKRK